MAKSKVKKIPKVGSLGWQVRSILTAIMDGRNSDITLTYEVWKQFYNEFIFYNDKGEMCVRVLDMHRLPTQDAIKRERAHIQNDEPRELIPTSWVVAQRRGWNEELWLERTREWKAEREAYLDGE